MSLKRKWIVLPLVLAYRTGTIASSQDPHPRRDERISVRRTTRVGGLQRALQNDQVDQVDEPHYLTACISPIPGYVADESTFFRVPAGNVKVVFDGGNGKFNETTKGKYPGYDSSMEYTFSYDLVGLQDHCKDCRIQINEGQSCDSPMTRYWNQNIKGAINPWRPEYGASYQSDRAGRTSGTFSMFNGFDYQDHKRRTVVVFDQDHKTRIGCGLLRQKALGVCDGKSLMDGGRFSTKSPPTQTGPDFPSGSIDNPDRPSSTQTGPDFPTKSQNTPAPLAPPTSAPTVPDNRDNPEPSADGPTSSSSGSSKGGKGGKGGKGKKKKKKGKKHKKHHKHSSRI